MGGVRHGLRQRAAQELDAGHTRTPIGFFQKQRQRLKSRRARINRQVDEELPAVRQHAAFVRKLGARLVANGLRIEPLDDFSPRRQICPLCHQLVFRLAVRLALA